MSVTGKIINDCKLQKPFRLMISGGSGTGKSTALQELVNTSHFSSPFDKIIYCYPDYLDEPPMIFDQIVENRPGTCDLHYFSTIPQNSLIIYDDLMSECGKSDDVMKLFSVIARKRNLSVIFIVQNIYDSNKQFRNIRLNATGFLLFNFYADKDVNKRLLRDLNVQSRVPKHLMDQIYSRPFSYIYVDIHPERRNNFDIVRGNIFDKNFSIYNKMEYIAIPKSDFLKYFSVTEVKEDTLRAVKHEIALPKRKGKRKRRRSLERWQSERRRESSERESSKRRKKSTSESSAESSE